MVGLVEWEGEASEYLSTQIRIVHYTVLLTLLPVNLFASAVIEPLAMVRKEGYLIFKPSIHIFEFKCGDNYIKY